MIRQIRFAFVVAMIVFAPMGTETAFSSELFQGYEVSKPYSGPTTFTPGERRDASLDFRYYANLASDSEHWPLPVSARTLMDQATPVPEGIPSWNTSLWWRQAGDYYMGGSLGWIVYDANGQEFPTVVAFVGKGSDFRSALTNPKIASGHYYGTDWVLKDMNSKGQIVVTPYVGNSTIYDFETDTKIELPPLTGDPTSTIKATGIDENGTVVGSSDFVDESGNLVKHAFIYRDGVMTDLNDLVILEDGFYIDFATDLTESGEIIANLVDPNKPGWTNWVKLTPALVPEPSSWVIGIMGVAFAAMTTRRTRRSRTA